MFPRSRNICTLAVATVALTTASLAAPGDAFAFDLRGPFGGRGPAPLTNKIGGGIGKLLDVGGKVIDKTVDVGGKVIDKAVYVRGKMIEQNQAAQGPGPRPTCRAGSRECGGGSAGKPGNPPEAKCSVRGVFGKYDPATGQCVITLGNGNPGTSSKPDSGAGYRCPKQLPYDPQTGRCRRAPDLEALAEEERAAAAERARTEARAEAAARARAEARAAAEAQAERLARPQVIYVGLPAPVVPGSPVLGPAATTAPVPAMAAPAAASTCLTKEYLQAGTVLFKDVCAKEWAMNSTTLPSQVVSAASRACLTKDYLQAGVVLFKDTCTSEWAINPPEQQSQVPQTPGGPQVR